MALKLQQSHREFMVPGNSTLRDHRSWINETYFVFWRWFHHTGKLLDMFYSHCWKQAHFCFVSDVWYIIIQISNQPNCKHTFVLDMYIPQGMSVFIIHRVHTDFVICYWELHTYLRMYQILYLQKDISFKVTFAFHKTVQNSLVRLHKQHIIVILVSQVEIG